MNKVDELEFNQNKIKQRLIELEGMYSDVHKRNVDILAEQHACNNRFNTIATLINSRMIDMNDLQKDMWTMMDIIKTLKDGEKCLEESALIEGYQKYEPKKKTGIDQVPPAKLL